MMGYIILYVVYIVYDILYIHLYVYIYILYIIDISSQSKKMMLMIIDSWGPPAPGENPIPLQ